MTKIKEFIPYEESMALKELGFNESCLAYWINETPPNPEGQCIVFYKKPWDDVRITNSIIEEYSWAPLYQQAFRWFEKEHSIFLERTVTTNVNEILDIVYTLKSWKFIPKEIKFENPYDCFDNNKSELACLRLMIDIVKNEKQNG